MSDSGASIVNAVVATLRERRALLPAVEIIERMGLAARAIARRRAEGALIEGLAPEKLQALDKLLEVDAADASALVAFLVQTTVLGSIEPIAMPFAKDGNGSIPSFPIQRRD
jgi:hypothetical protein